MSRVLVLDDEETYREQLEMNLSLDGHETQSAASGREGIDVGARFRPDVLVADWMLKNHIHGLYVSTVLQAILPEIETILITGFSSHDLKAAAEEALVFDFVEKPFDLDRIRRAVASAGKHPKAQARRCQFAMAELDPAGRIVYANARARDLFDETLAGRGAASLGALFSPEAMPDLSAAEERWVVVSPRAERPVTWHLRTQSPRCDGNRLIVLRRPGEPQYLDLGLIEMLLECEAPQPSSWPFEGRVLVVDDDELFRRSVVEVLEITGAGCYAVETHAEALRLFESDEGIHLVVVDYEMPGCRAADLVDKLRAVRPDVIIVGNSGSDRREAFAEMRVEHFLAKPWRAADLIDLLSK